MKLTPAPLLTSLTVNDHGGVGTAPLGHDVARQAGVVARVRQAGLRDDEVVVGSRADLSVRVQRFVVLQPGYLQTAETGGGRTLLKLPTVRCEG